MLKIKIIVFIESFEFSNDQKWSIEQPTHKFKLKAVNYSEIFSKSCLRKMGCVLYSCAHYSREDTVI